MLPSDKIIHLTRLKGRLEPLLNQSDEMFALYWSGVKNPFNIWQSQVRAVLRMIGTRRPIGFDSAIGQLETASATTKSARQQKVMTEAYNLLSEVALAIDFSEGFDGSFAFSSNENYKFFTALRAVIDGAEKEVFLIDPYLSGQSFHDFFGHMSAGIDIKLLGNKKISDVQTYTDKHVSNHTSNIDLRASNKLHDRVLFIDNVECWVIGGSIKDGAKKTSTYLIKLDSDITAEKLKIYGSLWEDARQISTL